MSSFALRVVGVVSSPLTGWESAPRQNDEGAPQATIIVRDEFAPALRGLVVGDEIIVLTWLHLAGRDALTVHPRGDPSRTPQGVFSTRSAERPNPVGLHQTRIVAVDGSSVRVESLEVVDGTPVIDVKPVLHADVGER